MMRIWKWVIFGGAVFLASWGLYNLISGKNELRNEASKMSAQLSDLKAENRDLSDQINYFKNPDNLVKELMSQTNYKFLNEKLIIITSGATSTLSTSSTATSTKQ